LIQRKTPGSEKISIFDSQFDQLNQHIFIMENKPKRVIISSLLIAVSFCFFYFTKSYQWTKEISANPRIEVFESSSGLAEYLRYIGLFLLVYAIWIWRDILDFSKIGFIGGKKIRPANPATVAKEMSGPEKNGQNPDEGDLFLVNQQNERIDAILQVINKNPAGVSNSKIISKSLGLPNEDVERLLFLMLRRGLVRKDIYPGTLNANFSDPDSPMNMALDFAKEKIAEKGDVFVDYRYMMIQDGYLVDGLFETEYYSYILNVVNVFKALNNNIIESGIRKLMDIESIYENNKPLKLVLVISYPPKYNEDNRRIINEYKDIQDNLKIIEYRGIQIQEIRN